MSFGRSINTDVGTATTVHVPIDPVLKQEGDDRAPSHRAVSVALNQKQNKIENSDDIVEGEDHLYFTGDRAKAAILTDALQDGSTGLAPNCSVVKAAIDAKQDLLKSSDDLKEGASHLFFSEKRAVAAVETYVERTIGQAASTKHAKMESSDELPEGKTNLYFTSARAQKAAVIDSIEPGNQLAASSSAVARALLAKQDLIKSSDDLVEGRENLFFSIKRISDLVSFAVSPLEDKIKFLEDKIKRLESDVTTLKPSWSDEMLGGNGNITVVTAITRFGPKTQTLTFKKGVLSDVSRETGPKKVEVE